MIARSQHLILRRLLRYFPAVGILGPRQVGKTTLAKALKSEMEKEVIYLDLEDFRDQARMGSDPFLFFEQYPESCIILDEIQRMPDLLPVLRSAIDRNRQPGRFILLGSASPQLLSQSAESLAGRISYIEMPGVSFWEAGQSGIPLLTHWFRGGFPQPLLTTDAFFRNEWFGSFIRSYIDVDLAAFGVNARPGTLSRLVRMLASLHGSTLNIEALSRSMGLRNALIRDYLDVLEGAYLIRRLQPYHSNQGKRMTRSPKLYIRDSGLLHYLVNIGAEDQLHQHVAKGASWESYVLEQIISQLANDVHPFFYQTAHQAEVDLVLEKGNVVQACFEIKLSDSPALSKGNHFATADMNCPHNFIVTYGAGDYLLPNGWRVTDLMHLGTHLKTLGLARPESLLNPR